MTLTDYILLPFLFPIRIYSSFSSIHHTASTSCNASMVLCSLPFNFGDNSIHSCPRPPVVRILWLLHDLWRQTIHNLCSHPPTHARDQVWYKIGWLEHDTKRYWSSYKSYQILCETRSVGHDILKLIARSTSLSIMWKKKSVFWPISLTDFSDTWSVQNIIMVKIGSSMWKKEQIVRF